MNLDNLRLSISNLWAEFGSADSLQLAVLFNLSMTVLGAVGVAWLYPSPWALAPFVWAALHIVPLVRAVPEVVA